MQALREVGVRIGRLHRPRRYNGRTLLLLSTFNLDDAREWPQLLTGTCRSNGSTATMTR